MADFTKVFSLTVTDGDGTLTDTDFPLNLGNCEIVKFIITFPPGCAGLVGAAIYAGGSPAYPVQQGTYIVFDDYKYEQEVDNQITTGQWDIHCYNLDFIPHTLQVLVQANYLRLSPQTSSSSTLVM